MWGDPEAGPGPEAAGRGGGSGRSAPLPAGAFRSLSGLGCPRVSAGLGRARPAGRSRGGSWKPPPGAGPGSPRRSGQFSLLERSCVCMRTGASCLRK